MTNGKIHVFLLAKNRLVCEALGRVLNKTSDIRVVMALGFSSTAIGQISAHTPDVLVLHPGPGGLVARDLEMIALLLRDQPKVEIVTIAMDAEEDVSQPGLGVPGPVLQDPSVAEVILAVRIAVRGGLSSRCDSDESNRFTLTAGTPGCTVPLACDTDPGRMVRAIHFCLHRGSLAVCGSGPTKRWGFVWNDPDRPSWRSSFQNHSERFLPGTVPRHVFLRRSSTSDY